MTSGIRRLVKSCEICQRVKSGGLQPSSRPDPLSVGRPWPKVAIDLVGPLPPIPRGNKLVWVFTDNFIHWQDAILLSGATAPIVAEGLGSSVLLFWSSTRIT